jgi:hypothetical protein
MPDTKVGIDIRPEAISRVYVDFDPSDLRGRSQPKLEKQCRNDNRNKADRCIPQILAEHSVPIDDAGKRAIRQVSRSEKVILTIIRLPRANMQRRLARPKWF